MSGLFGLVRPVRRKCFVSYYTGDSQSVDAFVAQFGHVFIPKAIGVSEGDDFIGSNDADYVMSRIRGKYLEDSTVTICMIGSCTHSRRYVDWELKSSLRQGLYSSPNGLLGVLLPGMDSAHLPPRFEANWSRDGSGYAQFFRYPTSPEELSSWIETAFARRTTHASLISNGGDMLLYNRTCRTHDTTH